MKAEKQKSAESTHYFVDESGDGVLFGSQGRVLLGQPEGRSHFMLGLLQVAQPQKLAQELETLRQDMLGTLISKTLHPCGPSATKPR